MYINLMMMLEEGICVSMTENMAGFALIHTDIIMNE